MTYRLFTPGPTELPTSVREAVSTPIIHHRTEEFHNMMKVITSGLHYLFQTQNTIYTFVASGTGVMEATIVNLFSAGDRVLVVKAGRFGERWAEISQAFGLKVIPIDIPWGESVPPELIQKHLKQYSDIKAVFTTLCETSTGVLTDIKGIGKLTQNSDVLLIVDAISGLAADEFKTDEWVVDVAIAASQKGLGSPPGLAFVSVNKKAQDAVQRATLPRYYWDFRLADKFLKKYETPFTSAVSNLYALRESLRLIQQQKLENIIAQKKRLANSLRAGIHSLGLKLFPTGLISQALTVIKLPDDISSTTIIKLLQEKHNIIVEDGQDRLKGKILRISNLGFITDSDIIFIISALESVLRDMGFKFCAGNGIKAVQQALI